MAKLMISGLLISFCLFVPASLEKQIKLEDIEKDNLRAAQQAKLEKQYQQYQQYHQYHQSPVQYDQQVYSQSQSLAYPSAYYQYALPQQYLQQNQQQQQQQQQQQHLYSSYAPLATNNLGTGYSSASAVHPFQAYYTPQLTAALQSLQGSQHITAPTQTQPIIMAIAQPSLGALQQQAYYQVSPKTLSTLGSVQYIPSQTAQTAQYYYQPQSQASTASSGAGLVYATSSQYIPSYPFLTSNKVGRASYPQQYVSTSPQSFSAAYASSDSDYAYPAQGSTYSSSSVYSQSEQPTFVSLKAPQHLVASPGQQQQYLQAQAQAHTQTTTVSPFKYLNSPQYLAQNYNTIQSSHLIPKNSFSSGIKSTVSPPVKFTGNTGYITPSSGSSSSSNAYQTYRGIAG